MSGNLFFLKGWTITLIAGLFAFVAKNATSDAAIIVYFPILMFWVLDGYFLSRERKFRALYDEVRLKNEDEIDFSMDTSKYSHSWIDAMWSTTILCFYLPLALITLIFIYK